jgi:parafibromin
MISDVETIQNTLLEWATAAPSKLSDAVLSDDGTTLTLGETVLDAAAKLTVLGNERSCEYTTGAIFLQVRDPAQGLLAYRNACKQFNVTDPVTALHKPVVVSFFLKELATAAAAAAAEPTNEAPVVTAAVTAAPASAAAADVDDRKHHREQRDKDRRKHQEKRDRDHHHHHHSSSSSRHKEVQSPKKKKKVDMMTNEQLFEHLNVVVDKRGTTSTADTAMVDAITTALSTKGFEITGKEQLEPYKEKTAAILANEIPVGNSASILRANNPRKDLTRVLELFSEAVSGGGGKDNKQKGKTTITASQSKHQAAGNAKKGNTFKPYLVGKKPVIVVPKGMTAPLTLVNAHEFLCNARFVSRDAMMKQQQQKGLRAPPTTFTRTIKSGLSTSLLEYEIIDNPRKLGPNAKEWERIVAVIVLGQSWQFKDWLQQPVAYNVPATLFDRVYGFYISMEGDKIPADVAGWAVQKSQINRDKRGLDSVTYASFWNGLDEWMKVYKAELLPQAES